MQYIAPRDLSEAVAVLAGGRRTVLAGGTDFYPARVGRPLTEDVLDIGRLDELRGIVRSGGHWRIGALTRWAEIAAAPLAPCFDGLRQAAREVGSVQVQNAGTVGGNLCNASPAADGVPPLLSLDASVELVSSAGIRSLPLEEFIVGYRQTAMRRDELLAAVLVPTGREEARAAFGKLGARRYLVISVAMVAVLLVTAAGVVTEARVAVGACSPVARRLRLLESALVGRALDGDLGSVVGPEHVAQLSPIDDIRAPAAFRLEAAVALIRRTLQRAGGAP